ncbi:MAG TPA: N-acetylmuramic acid 6-phosphate etherase [Candidatus Acidoferrum sp.]|nr:N-acetylmuramic acid 6-phosphate etherase [Candidatus Acidoferrum sp.]
MPIKTETQGRGRPAPAKGRTESQRDASNAERRRTELRLRASRNLDRMTAIEIVRLMNREDRKVAGIVGRQLRPIAKAVDAVVEAMSHGGRLFYVGAGSSGRMAVLDAAECPPTFGIPHSQMVALIAGGRRAVTGAVEGAEDAVANGARDLRRAGAKSGDVVVGIAASGTTPYVIGAMKFARRRGAKTIVVTSNGRMPLADLADILIAPEVGPEVLTGSTRLKAGTAQKMVLNMLSTAVMVRLGHVYENLMIDAIMTNQKLRERAVRMLVAASGADASSAGHALRAAGHSVRVALVMLKLGIPARAARKRLAEARGNLRAALGERFATRRKQLQEPQPAIAANQGESRRTHG